jgi:hypothetical protein
VVGVGDAERALVERPEVLAREEADRRQVGDDRALPGPVGEQQGAGGQGEAGRWRGGPAGSAEGAETRGAGGQVGQEEERVGGVGLGAGQQGGGQGDQRAEERPGRGAAQAAGEAKQGGDDQRAGEQVDAVGDPEVVGGVGEAGEGERAGQGGDQARGVEERGGQAPEQRHVQDEQPDEQEAVGAGRVAEQAGARVVEVGRQGAEAGRLDAVRVPGAAPGSGQLGRAVRPDEVQVVPDERRVEAGPDDV